MAKFEDIRVIDRTGSPENERAQLNSTIRAVRELLEDGASVEITEEFITLEEETDPTVPKWVKLITENDINNWDTAFGWGDWSVGVDKAFVDALNVDADTLDGLDSTDFLSSITNTDILDSDSLKRFQFLQTVSGGATHVTGANVKLYRDADFVDQTAEFGLACTFLKDTSVNSQFFRINYNSAGTELSPDGDNTISYGAANSVKFKQHTGGGIYNDVLTLNAAGDAALAGNLTINGNTAWHAGNDGIGSGLDADLLDGQNLSKPNAINTVVSRDSNGDISCRLVKQEYNVSAGTAFDYVNVQNAIGPGVDNSIRPATLAQFRTAIGGSGSGLDADTLDGRDSTDFGQLAAPTQTWTGENRFDANAIFGDKIGVGAPTPDAALHIANGANPQLIIEELSGSVAQINLNVGATTVGNWQTSGGDVYFDARDATGGINFRTGGTTTAFVLQSDQDAIFYGNVGVNTTSPTEKLDVNGKIRQRTLTADADDGDIVATKSYVDKPALDTFRRTYKPIRLIDANGYSPHITVTNSGGTRVNEKGFIEAVPDNTIRVNHDPVTGAYDKVLVEPAATNEQIYSEQFDNAAWSKTNATITANATEAPDGTLTADEVIDDATNGVHRVFQTSTVTTGVHTASVFVKANTITEVAILESADSGTTFFDLSDGSITSQGGSTTDASIEPYANGWYRIWITWDQLDTGAVVQLRLVKSGSSVYAGTGESLYLWGSQLEAGSGRTSYIPTAASTESRTADDLIVDGTAFGQIWNPDEMTVVVEAVINQNITPGGIVQADDGSTTNMWNIRQPGGGSVIDSVGVSGGVTQWDTSDVTVVPGQIERFALGIATNDIAFYSSGTSKGNDTSATLPTGLSRFKIGDAANGPLNGGIRQLTLYPKRLSNTELELISNVGADILGVENSQRLPSASEEHVVELGGDFAAGAKLLISREGNHVWVGTTAAGIFHGSSSLPASDAGIIPAHLHPPSGSRLNVFEITGSLVMKAVVGSGGDFAIEYRNWSGSLTAQTTPDAIAWVEYTI